MSVVYDYLQMPLFLENLALDAEVHFGFLHGLDSFQQHTEVLAETVKEFTGVHVCVYVTV